MSGDLVPYNIRQDHRNRCAIQGLGPILRALGLLSLSNSLFLKKYQREMRTLTKRKENEAEEI